MTVLEQSHLTVLHDLGVRGHPRGVPATGAEALAAGDPVTARHHDRLAGRGGAVGNDAARRVDPDRACDLPRHPGRIGREDPTLVDDPAGARVGLGQLLDHLDVARQVELQTAHGARQRQPEQPGVGQRLEERPRQLPLRLDLIGAGADLGG